MRTHNFAQDPHKIKTKLNEKKAADLRPKAEGFEVRDELVPGLILRVGKKGSKVWDVVVQTGPTSRRRIRLGTFPDVSVKDARRAAEAAKEDAARPNRSRDVRTVGDLFERYATARAPQMRTWHDVQSVWTVWAEARLAPVRLTDLTIHHALDLRDYVAAHSSPLRAANVIRYLRPMLSWAADERIIDANPWMGLKAREKAQARERVLSPSEWQMLWEAAGVEPYPFGPFLRALMLSAQRLSNVAQMRWDEIQGDVWVIPREKIKATRTAKAAAHEVRLSGALGTLIDEQPRLGPFVFTTRGDRPITPGSRQKERLEATANAEAAKAKGRLLIAKEALTAWRFHDIRRTGATLMTGGGVTRFIVERVLGHADTGVTAVYDRNLYREEKRAALEVLARTLT